MQEKLYYPNGSNLNSWKMEIILYKKGFAGAIVIDLNKAFGSITHESWVATCKIKCVWV